MEQAIPFFQQDKASWTIEDSESVLLWTCGATIILQLRRMRRNFAFNFF